jgi:hypothetical protein
MMQRFLFIGIGGSGGKTLRVLHDELEHRLASLPGGWDRGMPDGWQFLHIDVPTSPDGNDPDLPAQLPPSSYVGLVKRGVRYGDLDNSLIGRATDPNVLRSLAGWRPNPQYVHVPIDEGAGQYRSLGRIVAINRLSEINSAIGSAVANLDDKSLGDLGTIAKRLGMDADQPAGAPVAIIVSSLAGGSGSGVFLDVCDVLRARGAGWMDNSVGLLFAPDVFAEIPEAMRAGVHANALASLSELVAGHWNGDALSDAEAATLQQAGVAFVQFKRRGLARPFIVGASNGKVTFKRQNDMYQAMGKTLAAWTISPNIQDKMGAYVGGNWDNSAAQVRANDRTGLLGEHDNPPLSAIGFAGVALGRERFSEYASQRLARAGLERILRGHWDPSGEVEPAAALAAAADETAFEAFLRGSGLDEEGEDHNDVLDAVRPGGASSALKSQLSGLMDDVRGAVTKGRKSGQPPSAWAAAIKEAFKERKGAYEAADREARYANIQRWVGDIQVQLRDLVEATIAQQGASVTEELLRRLDAKLSSVIDSLQTEIVKLEGLEQRSRNGVGAELDTFGSQPMMADNPLIGKSVDQGAKAIFQSAEAELRSNAVDLISDLRQSFLQPMGKALRVAREKLGDEETRQSEDGEPPISTTWPNGEFIPTKFEPAANEVLIEPVSGYEDAFVEQIRKTVQVDAPRAAVDTATQRTVLFHQDDARAGEPRLITIERPWVPRRAEYRQDSGAAVKAEFSVNMALADLLKRCRLWVERQDDDNAIGVFVREPLREYLSASQADSGKRIDAFRRAFAEAVDSAQPLVNINTGLLSTAHGSDLKTLSIFSEIPFPQKHPAREVAEKILTTRGLLSESTKAVFGDGVQTRIDIFSVLASPYHPVVFDSLMEPIAGDWGEDSASKSSRAAFWQWRRSRPLAGFIPVGPAVRRAMVRGWFTAGLFSQVVPAKSGQVSIVVPERSASFAFPHPYLGPDPIDVDLLPAVLESMPIAFLDYRRNPDALAPYVRLRELGQSAGQDVYYDEANREVVSWIQDGELPTGAPKPNPDRVGLADGTATERQELVLQFLQAVRATFAEVAAQRVTREPQSFFRIPRAWELGDELIGELDLLIEAVGRIDVSSVVGVGATGI